MSSEKYHYEAGAVHNDNHKEINIGSVSEKALGDILKHFLKDDAEDTAFEEVRDDEPVPQPKTAPVEQETFADRVKAIIRKAATKNGQRIESHARGNAGAYIILYRCRCFLPGDGRDGEQLCRQLNTTAGWLA